jgi:large subunit ribosomal protein L31
MKSNIHPPYYPDAVVTCVCGNTFTTGSTKQKIQLEVCSACHPFYTGQARFIDTQGRVERFQAKQAAVGTYKKKAKKQARADETPKSLKDMLAEAKKRSH